MERVLSPVQNLMINFAPYVDNDRSVNTESELNEYYTDIVTNADEVNTRMRSFTREDKRRKLLNSYKSSMLLVEYYENKYDTTKNPEYRERALYFRNKANICADKVDELMN